MVDHPVHYSPDDVGVLHRDCRRRTEQAIQVDHFPQPKRRTNVCICCNVRFTYPLKETADGHYCKMCYYKLTGIYEED